jgi:tetratricopeptide (TPR) repeat protein
VAINRDKVLEAAQKFVEKKKYDKAVIELRKLVEADPNDARTLLKIGDLQAKQGLHADAIGTYESVGKLYSHQGFALKAIAVYKQIREIIAKHVPQLEERYGHIAPKLAELYQQLGLTSDALAALDEVATRLQRQQRDDEAIEVFRKIVELDPTNPLPHLRLAEALSRVKDSEGAVFEFKTAASQLAGLGRRDDAIKVLERLLHHKQDPEQAKICAELYLSRGQPQDGMQALAKLQVCFQANPRDFDTLSLLARAFNTIGQGAKAIEVQKEMARVARDTGKTDLFREIVERLQRVAPHDEGVRRLIQQQAGLATATPYGGQMPVPVQQAAAQQEAARVAAARPPTAGNGFAPANARAQNDALQRPRTGGYEPPRPAPVASQPEIEEVEELSYEDEIEELVEDDAELVSQGDYSAEEDAYGDEAEAATGTEGAVYTLDENEEGAEYTDVGSTADAYGGAPAQLSEAEIAEKVNKALADANAFRRVRLYARALETLQGAIELDPRSMDLREIHRDVLIEAGQTVDAVQEMLAIAGLYVDALDGDSAARALQDVLAFDPTNARAIEMLQELGYEIVDESEEAAAAEAAGAGYGEQVQDDGRLPAYDLDEPAPAHEPVAEDASAGYAEQLPSFPLDEPDADAAYADANAELPSIDHHAAVVHAPDVYDPSGATDPPPPGGHAPSVLPVRASTRPPSMRPPSIAAAASGELDDALEEADFFCSRGLFDDARAILTEQLSRHPNNPLLRERIAEVDAQEAQRGSGAREKPRDQADAFDLNSSLDALEGLDYGNMEPAEGHASGDEQVDVEEVFAKFKEGVAKQISVEDSDSHYNLGIAYKEMLLLDDAIREFEVAAMDPNRDCVCRSMIGMIELERGNVDQAIAAFLKGLDATVKDPTQDTVLNFEVGAAYEQKKLPREALTYYQKAMRRDPNYRDVQERVRRLAKNEPKQPAFQAAVGADDEFDRAFDDLLSKA